MLVNKSRKSTLISIAIEFLVVLQHRSIVSTTKMEVLRHNFFVYIRLKIVNTHTLHASETSFKQPYIQFSIVIESQSQWQQTIDSFLNIAILIKRTHRTAIIKVYCNFSTMSLKVNTRILRQIDKSLVQSNCTFLKRNSSSRISKFLSQVNLSSFSRHPLRTIVFHLLDNCLASRRFIAFIILIPDTINIRGFVNRLRID